MLYRPVPLIGLCITGLLALSSQGCSGTKWFSHGNDEQAQSGMTPIEGPDATRSRADRDSKGLSYGLGERADGSSSPVIRSEEMMSRNGSGGQHDPLMGDPSMDSRGGATESAFDAEGGALSGLSPVDGDRIAAEEHLSRSRIGTMLPPLNMQDEVYEQLKGEEAAAMAAGLQDVYYGYNRWTLEEPGVQALSRNAGWLKGNPTAQLRISGHCDERGSHDYNLVLGEKRALAAKQFLLNLGVNPKQLSIVSYGKDRPFCREHDEPCYQENRRGHMLLNMKD